MGQSSRSSSTLKKTFQTFKSFTPIQRTTSTTRMKYTFAILVIACAVAAANAGYGCHKQVCYRAFNDMNAQRGLLRTVVEQSCYALSGSLRSWCINFTNRNDVRKQLHNNYRMNFNPRKK